MSRRRTRDEPEDEPDDWSDGYDAYRDYDPDDPDTYPEGVYVEGEEDDASVPCPYCREEITEDAVQCRHCGMYLSREDVPPAGSRSRAWVVVMLLALVAAAMWVLAG